jgi:Fe-S cluster biogenesis protein NfuA
VKNTSDKKTLKAVDAILEKIRPFLKSHGGGAKLLGFNDGVARIELLGACAHCHLADLTYNKMVGELILERVPAVKKVDFVNLNSNKPAVKNGGNKK